MARIRAVLRRTGGGSTTTRPAASSTTSSSTRTPTRCAAAAGRSTLSPTEFKLLRYLMLNPNRVLSKAQILDHVWDYDFRGESRHRRVLHLLPAPQDRRRRAAGADPHQARRRLRPAPPAGGLSHDPARRAGRADRVAGHAAVAASAPPAASPLRPGRRCLSGAPGASRHAPLRLRLVAIMLVLLLVALTLTASATAVAHAPGPACGRVDRQLRLAPTAVAERPSTTSASPISEGIPDGYAFVVPALPTAAPPSPPTRLGRAAAPARSPR